MGEDTKALADAENKDRSSLLTKYKMMATDLENFREKLENENARKSDALKALSKAQSEIQLWKSRFETEGMGRVEELEAARNKLQAKIVESEELVDVLATKVANAEKSKTRMNSELDDLAMEYERVHAAALITEKRGKNFDKVLGEWQSKAADVSAEVAASQDEGRNYTSELFRLKAAQDEALEQLDIVKRENKNLADEIKDLLDQLGEGGRSIHDLDKQRRRLEQEKEELQGALEEAEGTLEQEENKVLRAQLELGQVKQEIDRRVAEKEEEFNNTRKNHARAMESMSASLEAEQKAKAEALRIRRSSRATSTSSRLLSTTPTRPTLRPRRQSSGTRASTGRPSAPTRRSRGRGRRLLRRRPSPTAVPTLFPERCRRLAPSLTLLREARGRRRLSSLSLVLPSTR